MDAPRSDARKDATRIPISDLLKNASLIDHQYTLRTHVVNKIENVLYGMLQTAATPCANICVYHHFPNFELSATHNHNPSFSTPTYPSKQPQVKAPPIPGGLLGRYALLRT